MVVLVVETVLNRVPVSFGSGVMEISHQSQCTPAQKRALLLKRGLLRSTGDELENLAQVGMCSSCFFFS